MQVPWRLEEQTHSLPWPWSTRRAGFHSVTSALLCRHGLCPLEFPKVLVLFTPDSDHSPTCLLFSNHPPLRSPLSSALAPHSYPPSAPEASPTVQCDGTVPSEPPAPGGSGRGRLGSPVADSPVPIKPFLRRGSKLRKPPHLADSQHL